MAGNHSARDRMKAERAREKAEIRAMKARSPKASELRALERSEARAARDPAGLGGVDGRPSGTGSEVHGGGDVPTGEMWATSLPGAYRSGQGSIRRSGRQSRNAVRGRSRLRGCLPWIAGFLVVVLIAVFFGYEWVQGQIRGAPTAGKSVVIVVPKGDSDAQIADLLAAKGVIAHPLVFRLYLKMHGAKPFEPGPYQFTPHEAFAKIVAELSKGPDQSLVARKLTIPDGFTLSQIAQRVGQLPGHTSAGFLSAAASGSVASPFAPAGSTNLEGLLFPDTFEISPHETDAQIIQQMIADFVDYAGKDQLTAGAQALGLTPYEVIIVASIIEKEAKFPDDAGKVSEVIYNRLKDKMPLQIDATVIYGLEQAGQTVTGPLTKAQTRIATPYNTYVIAGLPPAPISAPGQQALQAALHPTPGPWLYYVVTSQTGAESFASTLAEQDKNIQIAHQNGLP